MALPQGTPTLELDRGDKRHLHSAANEREATAPVLIRVSRDCSHRIAFSKPFDSRLRNNSSRWLEQKRPVAYLDCLTKEFTG